MSTIATATDGIVIYLIGRDQQLHYSKGSSYRAEDLCFEAARHCQIGPATRHLFGLRCLDSSEAWTGVLSYGTQVTWANPCQLVTVPDGGHKVHFEFRMRFRTPTVETLQLDSKALEYYFHQIRTDFLAGAIPDALKSHEKVLGLAVTDMLRVIKEKSVARDHIEKDYKKYLPREMTRSLLVTIGIRKAIHKSLADVEHKDIDVLYIKSQYVRQISELSSQYGCEDYTAHLDENGQVLEVKLQVDPFHPTQPGLRLLAPGKKKIPPGWFHVCTIEELCSVSMRKDGTVEISRRNGVPQYFKFQDMTKMYSFIGLLDGYYRLMEKWIFNLCKDLTSPFLLNLRTIKCHGPVGRKFSYRKLHEKRQNKPGSYILREGWNYDEYCVDICVESEDIPKTMVIYKNKEGRYQTRENTNVETFATIPEVIAYFGDYQYKKVLKECVPPSEYDVTQLLLCRPEKEKAASENQSNVITSPLVINRGDLSLDPLHGEMTGRLTSVISGTWRLNPSSQLKVAVKRLNVPITDKLTSEFLQTASQCLFWQCEAIVAMFGIVLANPLAMVTEFLPLGSLDKCLRNHKDSLQEVDLVEAATYLGKALWYLEERGFVHGNIRCRNLLVLSMEENSFKIKLADPGVAIYTATEIHWIPPECYHHFSDAKRSLAADVWSFATTLWEIFSFGEAPLKGADLGVIKQMYKKGTRLQQPERCHEDVYKLMNECWNRDPDARKKPQAIMRDINQTLYEVHNSRRTHTYSTIYSHNEELLLSSSEFTDKNTILDTPKNQNRSVDTVITDVIGGSSIDSDLSSLIAAATSQTATDTSHLMDSGIPPINAKSRLLTPERTTEEVLGSLAALTISPSDVSLESMVQDSQWWLIEMSQLKMLDRLGQGFYGEVRRAILTRWSGLQKQEVAVKQLKSTYATAGNQDLLREIAIMKSLQHKNIVEIKGVVEDPKTLLVMEYVPLGSLLIYIRTHKERLTEKMLLKFSADIAEGMEYLCERRIIHRDLAARNILVSSTDTVKISDFGLAQMTGPKDYYKLKTNRELPIRWYAPETIRHWKFTFKSDVWSFGVTLWEMFSYGEEPIIDGCKDDELLQTLEEGKRLKCPNTCSVRIYTHLMHKCWDQNDELRPDFAKLLPEIIDLYDNS